LQEKKLVSNGDFSNLNQTIEEQKKLIAHLYGKIDVLKKKANRKKSKK
jgi:hypothetical protein